MASFVARPQSFGFFLRSILEANACSVLCRNIDALKRKLTKSWDEISLDVVRAAVAAFPKRLRSVVKARGKLFDYTDFNIVLYRFTNNIV